MIVSYKFDSFNPIIFAFILFCNRNISFLSLSTMDVWAANSLMWGALLCFEGCLATFPASTDKTPVTLCGSRPCQVNPGGKTDSS